MRKNERPWSSFEVPETEESIKGWRTYVTEDGRRGFGDEYPTGVIDPEGFADLKARFPGSAAKYQPATIDEVADARAFWAWQNDHYTKHGCYPP